MTSCLSVESHLDWLQAAIHSVVAGGRVITVGMGCDHAHLPVSTINCKEIDLMGSFRYANTVSPASHCNCSFPIAITSSACCCEG